MISNINTQKGYLKNITTTSKKFDFYRFCWNIIQNFYFYMTILLMKFYYVIFLVKILEIKLISIEATGYKFLQT